MEENNWLKKELRKIELTRKQMNDQYNTLEESPHISDIDKQVYLPHKFAPVSGQTWQSYIEQLKIFVKFADEKNIATHINGPRRAWYTHKSSPSCFMCEDVDLRHVMLTAMELMAKQYPKSIY